MPLHFGAREGHSLMFVGQPPVTDPEPGDGFGSQGGWGIVEPEPEPEVALGDSWGTAATGPSEFPPYWTRPDEGRN